MAGSARAATEAAVATEAVVIGPVRSGTVAGSVAVAAKPCRAVAGAPVPAMAAGAAAAVRCDGEAPSLAWMGA